MATPSLPRRAAALSALTLAGTVLLGGPAFAAPGGDGDVRIHVAGTASAPRPDRPKMRRVSPGAVDSCAHARGEPYVETRLLFGTARPDGGPAVTDRQFMAFVDKEVTRAFPDGLTVQSARGQWRDANGTIEKERSYELILLYPESLADASDRSIEDIRRAYEKAFGQESVGRVDERAQVDF
ncbi:DUF3574 domain-containing protein [Streptomyces sp. NPDC002520]